LHVTFSYGDGAYALQLPENKKPTAGLAMGFDKTLNANQNPTAMRHSSSSSRFRFKLRFTV
jgi:hypothetical protein